MNLNLICPFYYILSFIFPPPYYFFIIQEYFYSEVYSWVLYFWLCPLKLAVVLRQHMLLNTAISLKLKITLSERFGF